MRSPDYFNQHYSELSGVSHFCARKYYWNTYLEVDDLFQEGLMTAWRSVYSQPKCTVSFLRDRCNSGVFAAYKRGRSVDNSFQNTYRRKYPTPTVFLEDVKESIADKRADPEETAISNIMLEKFFERLTSIQQWFLKYLMEGYFLTEITQKLKLSNRKAAKVFQGIKRTFVEVYMEA